MMKVFDENGNPLYVMKKHTQGGPTVKSQDDSAVVVLTTEKRLGKSLGIRPGLKSKYACQLVNP